MPLFRAKQGTQLPVAFKNAKQNMLIQSVAKGKIAFVRTKVHETKIKTKNHIIKIKEIKL